MGFKGNIAVHHDTSSGEAGFNWADSKVIAFGYEYGLDNPCFLDNTIPQWSSITTYSIGDIVWNSAGSKGDGTCGCFKSKQDNNLNHQPDTPDAWWTQISEVYPSGNPDWNAWPPYGGFGKTPKYMMVTFAGFSPIVGGINGWPHNPPGPNRTFILHQMDNYYWKCHTYDDATRGDGTGGYECWLYLCGSGITSGCDNYIMLESLWYWPWASGIHYVVGAMVYTGGDTKWACKIEHISSGANQPPIEDSNEWWDNLGSDCDDNWCGCPIAFVSCVPPPSGWPAWAIDTSYSTDWYCTGVDIVQHGGSHYICIDQHTSAAITEPGVGAGWENVWKLSVATELAHPCKLGVTVECTSYGQDGDVGCGAIWPHNDALAIAYPGVTGVNSWRSGKNYVVGNKVTNGGGLYICKANHLSSSTNEPGEGVNWEDYWYQIGGGCSGSGLY